MNDSLAGLLQLFIILNKDDDNHYHINVRMTDLGIVSVSVASNGEDQMPCTDLQGDKFLCGMGLTLDQALQQLNRIAASTVAIYNKELNNGE